MAVGRNPLAVNASASSRHFSSPTIAIFDLLAFLHHEGHVAPVPCTLPSFESFKHGQRPDFSLSCDGFLRNLDDPVIVSLLQHSPNFYLQRFPRTSIISTGMVIISFYPFVLLLPLPLDFVIFDPRVGTELLDLSLSAGIFYFRRRHFQCNHLLRCCRFSGCYC